MLEHAEGGSGGGSDSEFGEERSRVGALHPWPEGVRRTSGCLAEREAGRDEGGGEEDERSGGGGHRREEGEEQREREDMAPHCRQGAAGSFASFFTNDPKLSADPPLECACANVDQSATCNASNSSTKS